MHGISGGLEVEAGSFVHSQGVPQKPAQLDGPDAKLKIALISELRRAAHAAAVSHRLEHLRVCGSDHADRHRRKERHHAD